MKFFTKNNYKKIWSDSEGGDLNDIMNSVKQGLVLKLLVVSQDGYTYIIKCHTTEVYNGNNKFSIQTDYDGFPDRLRYFKAIRNLGERYDELQGESNYEEARYISTKFIKTEFFLTSFIFNSDGSLIQRYLF